MTEFERQIESLKTYDFDLPAPLFYLKNNHKHFIHKAKDMLENYGHITLVYSITMKQEDLETLQEQIEKKVSHGATGILLVVDTGRVEDLRHFGDFLLSVSTMVDLVLIRGNDEVLQRIRRHKQEDSRIGRRLQIFEEEETDE